MSQKEALKIAQKYCKSVQVTYFIITLGFPPKEALQRVGIKL